MVPLMLLCNEFPYSDSDLEDDGLDSDTQDIIYAQMFFSGSSATDHVESKPAVGELKWSKCLLIDCVST